MRAVGESFPPSNTGMPEKTRFPPYAARRTPQWLHFPEMSAFLWKTFKGCCGWSSWARRSRAAGQLADPERSLSAFRICEEGWKNQEKEVWDHKQNASWRASRPNISQFLSPQNRRIQVFRRPKVCETSGREAGKCAGT